MHEIKDAARQREHNDSYHAAKKVKDIDEALDLWIESLDHFISTGAPMTLSAIRTQGLRRVLNQLRDEREDCTSAVQWCLDEHGETG